MHINRHEGRHSVARIIFHGNRGELRQPYREGQEDQLAALGFALNVLVLWNTQYMDDAVNHLRSTGRELSDEHLARLSPLQYEHVLMLGTFPFTLPHELARAAGGHYESATEPLSVRSCSIATGGPIAEEALPLGDPGALGERLTEIALEAGLTVREPLDARAVSGVRPPGDPGAYNRAVLLRRKPSTMTLTLLADLRNLFSARDADWQQTAAAWLVRGQAPTRSQPLPVVSSHALNGSQEAAVHSALSSPVCVVTGPPGTGKSQFVAALVATARDRDLTVLVASTNNGAVDEAVKRASTAHPATILRTGNATYRKELIATLEAICGDVAQDPDRDQARGSHRATAVRREHARAALDTRAKELRDLDETAVIASRLADALWNGRTPERSGEELVRLLARAGRARRWWRWRARRNLLRDLSLGSSRAPADSLDDLIAWARTALRLCQAGEQLDFAASAGEWERWQHSQEAWLQSGRALVAATAQAAVHSAGERLDGLLAAYREDDGKRGRALLEWLDVLPAWGTSAMSVRPSFACRPAIFDVVVIDEASQCTLPAVLPLAFRAKQIVIVGDPNQLPPVVTLPSDELEQIPESVGLTMRELGERRQRYGVDSCYSAFRNLVDDELFLDEHYRCHPDIAGFCDDEFYSGRLNVLTNTRRAAAPPVTGLSWQQVSGIAAPGKTGGRVNAAEVDAIVDWVVEHMPALIGAGSDLGIVTPFVAQASLMRAQLDRAIDRPTREALRLRIGTAHTFQGAERDVMLFSTVVADGVPEGTIGWLERNRYLVNVAVSRARLALVVFGDARHLTRLGRARWPPCTRTRDRKHIARRSSATPRRRCSHAFRPTSTSGSAYGSRTTRRP